MTLGLMELAPKSHTFPTKKTNGRHADLMFPPPLLVRLPPQLPRVAGCRPHCRAVPLRARRSCQPGPPEDPGEIEESAPTPGGTVAKIRYLWVPCCNHGDLSFVALRGKTWEVPHQFLASWSDFLGENGNYMAIHRKMVFGCHQLPPFGRVEAANQSLGKRNIHRVTPLLRPGKVMKTRVQQQMMANRMPIRTVYFSQLEILCQNFGSVLRYDIYHSPTSK